MKVSTFMFFIESLATTKWFSALAGNPFIRNQKVGTKKAISLSQWNFEISSNYKRFEHCFCHRIHYGSILKKKIEIKKQRFGLLSNFFSHEHAYLIK